MRPVSSPAQTLPQIKRALLPPSMRVSNKSNSPWPTLSLGPVLVAVSLLGLFFFQLVPTIKVGAPLRNFPDIVMGPDIGICICIS